MALKTTYDSLEDIPEQYRELFTERNGKHELSGIEGIKTQADIDRLQLALTKERGEHKAIKDKLALFNDLDPEEVHTQLDKIPALEAAVGDKLDEAKIDEIVEGRIRTKLAPVERERDKAVRERDEAFVERDEAKTKIKQGRIRAAVTQAAIEGKIVETALEDVTMLADRMFEVNDDNTVTVKDGVGITPGIDPKTWVQEMQGKRPHWFPPSEGGGSGGGQGGGSSMANPWRLDQWNVTEQGKVYKDNPERAAQLAKMAGTSIGGAKPIVVPAAK